MNHVVVVAHPDDEALWLSAALAGAKSVILCFGAPFGRAEKAESRQRAVAELPLSNIINLAIPESGVHKLVDWTNPELTPTGMAIREPAAQNRYDENFNRLTTALAPLLQGVTDVYTHNGWGEYGHPDHVQVHRAVAALQQDFPFTLWFSNYVGPASFSLARQLGARPCWSEKRIVRPNARLAKRLRGVYQRHGVWTWSSLHRWPREEVYYGQTAGAAARQNLSGETLLDISALRWWRRPRAALRRLT